MTGLHSVEYLARAVAAGAVWAQIPEDDVWTLATQHCSVLLGWRVMGHPAEVSGRALLLVAQGSGPYLALFEAQKSLGLRARLD